MTEHPAAPTRNEFVRAALERIDAARAAGAGLAATAIRVELLTMWERGAAEARAAARKEVLPDIQHALAMLDEVHDLAAYGDSIESSLLEAHATLSTLVDSLSTDTREEPTNE